MKPSTARLLSMLPGRFIVRVLCVLDGSDMRACDAAVLDGEGKPTSLDASYPGFVTCLERLVTSGYVIHAGDSGRHAGAGTGKGFIDRHYITVIRHTKKESNPS